MVRYFDFIYYAMGLIILLAIGYSALAGLKLRSKSANLILRRTALGISLAAGGTAITLISALLADFFLKRSAYFQQSRFAAFYVGFALITFGLITTIRAAQETLSLPRYLSQPKITSSLVWLLFLGSLAISVFYLANPATFILNIYGLQVQRPVYWLPMLIPAFAGALLLFLVAFNLRKTGKREYLLWMGAYAAFVLVGLLKESLIIPSLGDPLTDLLVAYIPFVSGSLCLGFGARSLLKNDDT
jgi:hypothetical protein